MSLRGFFLLQIRLSTYFDHSIEPIFHSFRRIRVKANRNKIGINFSIRLLLDFISIGIMIATSMSNIINSIIIVIKFVENAIFFELNAMNPHSNLLFSIVFIPLLLYSFIDMNNIISPIQRTIDNSIKSIISTNLFSSNWKLNVFVHTTRLFPSPVHR